VLTRCIDHDRVFGFRERFANGRDATSLQEHHAIGDVWSVDGVDQATTYQNWPSLRAAGDLIMGDRQGCTTDGKAKGYDKSHRPHRCS
jgi:hypothetical protein